MCVPPHPSSPHPKFARCLTSNSRCSFWELQRWTLEDPILKSAGASPDRQTHTHMFTPQAQLPKRFLVDDAWAILDNFSATKASLMAPQEGKIKAQGWPCVSFFGDMPAPLYKDVACHLQANAQAISAGSFGEISDDTAEVDKLLALADGAGDEMGGGDDKDGSASQDDADDDDAPPGQNPRCATVDAPMPDACGDSFRSPSKIATREASSPSTAAPTSASKHVSSRTPPTIDQSSPASALSKTRRSTSEATAASPMEKVQARSEEASAHVAAAIARLTAKQSS